MGGAAKVFAWLNRFLCWLGIILILVFSIVLGIKDPRFFMLLFAILEFIPSALVSRAMIKSIDEMDKQVWIGVLGIFFVSVLGGIFYLCWRPYDYSSYQSQTYFAPNNNISSFDSAPSSNIEKKSTVELVKPEHALLEIKKLYDLGILDEDQYKEKVEKYKILI